MGTYYILGTITFIEQKEEFPPFEKERINRIIGQLEEKGGLVGKPLSGLPFFREKKFNGNRLYFLIYEEWKTILVVTTGPKKRQDRIIAEIVSRLTEYKEYVRQNLVSKGII